MVFFIVALRALAACLITNSHYGSIYPISALGSGGLLGDILFFAISGWCLYNVRGSFPRWYGKRLLRIYPPVLIITGIYLLIGFQSVSVTPALELFVYPTSYHFIASILVLYIPFYFAMKLRILREHIPLVMIALAMVYLVIYTFFYDKAYNHIDVVEEPMIRFLFAESMLLGAWFRQNDHKFRNRKCALDFLAVGVLFAAHLIYKLYLADIEALLPFQIANQIILFALLFFLFRLFAGLDSKFEALPKMVKKITAFASELTLEIYLVQHLVIFMLGNRFPFPTNWLVVTAVILLEAFVLHKVCFVLQLGFRRLFCRKKTTT